MLVRDTVPDAEDGVLEGDGARTRYIRVFDEREIPAEAARRLLREAVA